MIPDGVRARFGLRRDESERHAVIDIGSNTVRLVIYGGPPRAPAVLWNEKVSARLGRDLARNGAIPAAAMEEALAALARYALLLSEERIDNVQVVATAAAREATNGPEFLRRVERLGLAVRVLSGEEEARASALGAIGAFPHADGIVADLGGGSLELVAVTDGECGTAATFALGTLRLPALRAAGGFDRKVAKLLNGADWAREGRPLYMVGGTWRALAVYAMRAADHPLTDPHGFTIGAEDAAALSRELIRAKPALLAQQRGISAMRAEKLPDAAALLKALLTELRPEGLVFSSWGLREGLFYRSLPAGERARDPLLAGVAAFSGGRAGSEESARAITKWTAEAARDCGEGTERLRFAAAQLALSLHCAEPNLRAAQALEWALDKRWIGIDFGGRAMLAAALRGSLGVTEPHPHLALLASEGGLREATAWGLAFRLAQRLGAGAASPLAASRLKVGSGQVELRLPKRLVALAGPSVGKDLAALAAWLNAAPKLSIDD